MPAVVAVVLALLGTTALVAGCSTEEPASGPGPGTGGAGVEANARVVRVVDGDTVVADLDGQEERVRLIGIDTPESVKQGSTVECFGKEASNHTKELLAEGTAVRIELDAEPRDRYDRLLGYVYRASDGLFVNLAIVRDGYGNSYTFPPNVAHTDQFRDAAAAARDGGVGLWSACANDLPFPPDQR
ncbi:MAG: thermonuclease family protein [Acidimicrobiales bacterium]